VERIAGSQKVGGGFLEPIAPLLVPQAGVLGSQPPVPVIAQIPAILQRAPFLGE
jgi:hypothetical protein